MKLNNNGWGLAELLIGIAIILIFLFTAVFFSLRLNKMLEHDIVKKDIENSKDYSSYYIDIQNDMVVATNNYIKDNNLELEQGNYIKVDLSTLVVLNYMSEVVDPISDFKCKGYTMATKDVDDIVDIKAYLSCDNYVSKGYEY